MIARPCYDALLAHLPKAQVTVITGMRRVGKSTAIKYLLNHIQHSNKLFLDLERVEWRYLFNQPNYKEIERGLAIEGIDLTKPAVIALDEIQLVQQLPSVIKYLYDTYAVKFIVSGSSSYYLKNHFSESLAGRKRIFEMWPLGFDEFLTFKGFDNELLIKNSWQTHHNTFYLHWNAQYEEFLRWGGFPEVVLADTVDDKKAYLKDLIEAYIELDIKLLSDFAASDALYGLIRLLSTRVGSLIDQNKLGNILGINRNKLKDYLTLLEYTYFTQRVDAFSSSVDKVMIKQSKIYLSDTGILQQLGQVSFGQVFENAIAIQLKRVGELHYYRLPSGKEIDFILDRKEAFEVKDTPVETDLTSLRLRAQSIGLPEHKLVGRFPPGSGFSGFYWGGGLIPVRPES
jgi:uncharacterized protein